jgi:hypothetical protein
MKKIIVSLVLMTGLIVACSKSNDSNSSATDCSGTAKSFSTDVDPIVQSYCAVSGCHAAGSTNGPGALTTYQQIFNNRSAIRTAVANGSMPQNGRLSTSQKSAIICWIDNGAANN